jgi:YjbE family integral membrane protein
MHSSHVPPRAAFVIMDFLSDPKFWAGWVRIVIIDLLLAGDNALVIALAVRSLPQREQFWGRIFGTAGAVILRLLFVTIVTFLLTIPLLRLVGGLLLIWIALKLVRQDGGDADHARQGTTLKQAIGIIILADVVMSLDNVIAIAGAARGDLMLVAFGLLLSLPLVVWGSSMLSRLMNHYPVIIWLGGGVLGWVAGHMILDDPFVAGWVAAWWDVLHHSAPYFLGALISAIGWWFARSAHSAKAR